MMSPLDTSPTAISLAVQSTPAPAAGAPDKTPAKVTDADIARAKKIAIKAATMIADNPLFLKEKHRPLRDMLSELEQAAKVIKDAPEKATPKQVKTMNAALTKAETRAREVAEDPSNSNVGRDGTDLLKQLKLLE